MIAIDTNFAVAGWPTPLRSRLSRRNTESSLFCRSGTTFLIFFPLPQDQNIFGFTRARYEASAGTYEIDTFPNSGTPGTHVLREDVSMVRLVNAQLGIVFLLLRHSDEESVKFRHKQASPCQRSGQQFCEHAVMVGVYLLHHVERAFGPGGIDSLMRPIVEHAVGFTADGESSNFTSGLAVEHDNTRGITATYK